MVSPLHFTTPFAFASLHPLVPGGECRSASAALLIHPYEFTGLYEFTRIRNDILSIAALTLQALTAGPNSSLNFDKIYDA